MFKYDFIILYEHRARELENAVLLAMMLEKKGYKVAIEYRRSIRLFFRKADVILTPFLYDNDNAVDQIFQPFCHYKKVINLQYEQVFTKKNEEILGDLPKGYARNASHISWGKNTSERFRNVGIKQEKIFEIGHVSMDLNMPKYRDVFLSRATLSASSNLSTEKKWLLFISSFSCIGLTNTELEKWSKQTVGTEEFSALSYKSQPILLDYFEELAKEHPDLEIIYRPHPHEVACNRLFKLEKKYSNFKVIAKHSIRQWIIVSDYISTWCSTSLVDVLYAKKECAIIRPIPFREEYDYKIFRDQKILSDFHDLEEFISKSNESAYYVNPKTISEYYCNNSDANTFEKLRDVCIQVKENKDYEFDFFKAIHPSPWRLLKIYIYKILLSFAEYVDYSKITPEKYRSDVQDVYREMHKYKKDIKYYRKRFSGILKNAEA